jgi:hypothetical protein
MLLVHSLMLLVHSLILLVISPDTAGSSLFYLFLTDAFSFSLKLIVQQLYATYYLTDAISSLSDAIDLFTDAICSCPHTDPNGSLTDATILAYLLILLFLSFEIVIANLAHNLTIGSLSKTSFRSNNSKHIKRSQETKKMLSSC